VDGFVVDRADRRDVLAFYHCVYGASGMYEENHGWVGNAATCAAGSTSGVFKDDVLRRVNFFRALTGLPADIRFTDTKSAKAQKSALMMSKAGALEHFPTNAWPCYTADGAAAAGAGNLALGSYGPMAMDQYMRDDGANNRPVGHRRWILYSRALEMGTGDIPAHGPYPSTNTLWVVGDFKSAPAPSFRAWPEGGFFPFPLMPARWSLSYPGADFSSASVVMAVGGSTVPVTVVSRTDNGIGDNTIVWEPSALPTSLDGDLTCSITVAGIGGGGPSSRTYAVTLFDPYVLGESVWIAGTASPSVAGQPYTFNAIPQADEYELEVTSLRTGTWTEGAEDAPAPRIEGNLSAGYGLRQPEVKRTGSKSFHLAYPDGVFSDQSFVVTRDIVPAAGSRLQYYDRARFSAITTTLEAQVTSDNGETWTTLSSRVGVGGSSASWDESWIARDIDLSAYAGRVIRIRFLMKRNAGAVFQGVSDAYGFFIDDITVTGARQLADPVITRMPSASSGFALNAATAGAPLQPGTSYAMRIRPNVGCRWFEYGPVRIVSTVAPDPSPDIAVSLLSGRELASGSKSVGFGRIAVGRSVTKTFTIRNTGTGELRGLAVTKMGTQAADFTVSLLRKKRLAPGEKTTFKVIFKPTAEGTRKAVLKIASNDPNENPFTIRVVGAGTAR
jgi:hypothetical protein